MADFSIIASIISIAGAGFRLSLVLNAVGVDMATADVEIQKIARAISEYAFTLKQLALTLDSAKSIATQSALECARKIADQSQVVFDDIKKMTELDQKNDERGHLQAIAVAQRVQWCSQKHRVQYLLGQLESLKLSLSIMLQVLQMGKLLVSLREEPPRSPPSEHTMLQERAEIQNMVVVRHWSLMDLHRLYGLAEQEVEEKRNHHRIESPPPRYDGIGQTYSDPRLQIEGPHNGENMNKAMVKYNETPLQNLDQSLNKALSQPNRLLRAPGEDIVDRLLDEWTRVRGTPPKKSRRKTSKYTPRYATDSEDSEMDFERSEDIGGRYLDAPPRKPKNVHFERAHVESESEESDHHRPRHRPPRHAVLDSDSVSTSTTDSDSDSPPPRIPRRYSDGTKAKPAMQEVADRDRRPYNGGGSPQSSRPNSRSGPHQVPQSPRPGQFPNNPFWTGQAPPPPPPPTASNSNGLRPPGAYNNLHPGGAKRAASLGPGSMAMASVPHHNITPGSSPNTNRMYFPPPPPPSGIPPQQQQQYSPQQSRSERHRHGKRERRERRNGADGGGKGSGDKHSFKEHAKRDVKRGLIGAGAVAGLMDIIEGLGSI